MTSFAPTNTPVQPAVRSEPSLVSWVAVASLLFWPRAAILAFWIFSDLLGRAYDGWVVPVLGFLVAPYTTIAYAVMWSVSSDVVAGWEWIVVGAAAIVDVAVHAWMLALRR